MSIFPSIQPAEIETSRTQELPLFQEVAWDYGLNVPVFRQGEPVVVTGIEAVKVWIWKALKTQRYRNEIYSWDYGSEFETLIGQAYTPILKEAEAPRYFRECLLINPYIVSVKGISAAFEGGTLSMSGTVVTIYGEVEVNVDF